MWHSSSTGRVQSAVAEHAGVGLLAESGHGGGLDLGGEGAGGGGGVVEGVDLGADGGVFVGDDSIGDAGVDEGHLEGAVTEEGGDGFEAHATVDRLGGEGVAELVGVDVADAGVAADGGHDAMHGSSVDRCVVVGDEPVLGADVVGVGGGPLGEEGDEFGVEWDEAVVAEFADGDAEPVGVTDLGDGVGGEVAEFAGAQSGAGEDLGDEPVAGEAVGAGGGHEAWRRRGR